MYIVLMAYIIFYVLPVYIMYILIIYHIIPEVLADSLNLRACKGPTCRQGR